MTTDPYLTAEDYTYLLPDHWIQPQDSIWTIMHNAYVGRVIELAKESGARRVIEIGCGDGWNCGQAVEAGLDAVGIDWSRNGIDHARRMVPEATFICGDLRSEEVLETCLGAFDAAIFVEVLEHIPPDDCASALRNIAALLRPAGTLVLTTPSVNYPNTNRAHYRHFTEEILRDLFAEAGCFEIESVEGYGDVPAEHRYYRRARWVENRYWEIKPVKKWLQDRYRPHVLGAPLDRCHGFIVRARRTGSSP